VRRVRAGYSWHPATDQLMGTDVYGTYVNDPTADTTFSIAYDINDVSEFLFTTGDYKKWLIASKETVVGTFYENAPRLITKSSVSQTPYVARWYRRWGAIEDPLISLSDHHNAIGSGDILYGGAGYSSSTHASAVLPFHNGANVFVRFKSHSEDCNIVSDFDFPGSDINFIDNIMSAEACADLCFNYNGCDAWTWGKKPGNVWTNRCHLKSGPPFGTPSDCCDSGYKNACAAQTGRRALGKSRLMQLFSRLFGKDKSDSGSESDSSEGEFDTPESIDDGESTETTDSDHVTETENTGDARELEISDGTQELEVEYDANQSEGSFRTIYDSMVDNLDSADNSDSAYGPDRSESGSEAGSLGEEADTPESTDDGEFTESMESADSNGATEGSEAADGGDAMEPRFDVSEADSSAEKFDTPESADNVHSAESMEAAESGDSTEPRSDESEADFSEEEATDGNEATEGSEAADSGDVTEPRSESPERNSAAEEFDTSDSADDGDSNESMEVADSNIASEAAINDAFGDAERADSGDAAKTISESLEIDSSAKEVNTPDLEDGESTEATENQDASESFEAADSSDATEVLDSEHDAIESSDISAN